MNSRPPGLSDDNTHLPDPWSQFLTKHSELAGNSEQNSSPRTPVDIGGVAAMPSELTTETEKYIFLYIEIYNYNKFIIICNNLNY